MGLLWLRFRSFLQVKNNNHNGINKEKGDELERDSWSLLYPILFYSFISEHTLHVSLELKGDWAVCGSGNKKRCFAIANYVYGEMGHFTRANICLGLILQSVRIVQHPVLDSHSVADCCRFGVLILLTRFVECMIKETPGMACYFLCSYGGGGGRGGRPTELDNLHLLFDSF